MEGLANQIILGSIVSALALVAGWCFHPLLLSSGWWDDGIRWGSAGIWIDIFNYKVIQQLLTLSLSNQNETVL